jgi:hypothetical protein
MQSNGTRIAALLVTLAVIVGLFFAFKGGNDDDSTTATTATTDTAATTTDGSGSGSGSAGEKKKEKPADSSVPVIEVVGGQPQGGIAGLDFNQGDEIRFDVTSDTADEVHVHGYDIEEEVPAGGTAKFDFPADLEGVFEVELHGSETQIAELTVNP